MSVVIEVYGKLRKKGSYEREEQNVKNSAVLNKIGIIVF